MSAGGIAFPAVHRAMVFCADVAIDDRQNCVARAQHSIVLFDAWQTEAIGKGAHE